MNIRRILVRISEFYTQELISFKSAITREEDCLLPSGYQRFDNLAARFGIPFFQHKLEQCSEILIAINRIMRQLKCLGKINSIEGFPQLTSCFATYPGYRAVFEMACRWYNLGSAGLDGDSYLFSLKSIDWLYEFYCLFKLIDTIEAMGYRLVETKDLTRRSRNRDFSRAVYLYML